MRRLFPRLRRLAALVLFTWLAGTFAPTAVALVGTEEPEFLGELCSIGHGAARQPSTGDPADRTADEPRGGHCALCALHAAAAPTAGASSAFVALRERVEPALADDPPRPGIVLRSAGGPRAPPPHG